MKIKYYLIIVAIFISCNKKVKPIKNNFVEKTEKKIETLNYDSCKQEIKKIKITNRTNWNNLSKTSKEKIFTESIIATIIPSWIGTAWDFNGVTEIPQQCSIACGYFVTTVLRDAGLSLARIKLAQSTSEKMITSLVQSKYLQRFSNVPIKKFIENIRQQGYGMYLVGLDNHTGFIYNDGNEIHFIHSTFVGTKNVQHEVAVNSWVLAQSKYKIIGKISSDEKVLEQWIRP